MDFSNWREISIKNRFLFGIMLLHFFYCILLYFCSSLAFAFYGIFDIMYIGMMIDSESGLIKNKQYSSMVTFYCIQCFIISFLMFEHSNYSIFAIIDLVIVLFIIGISISMHFKDRRKRDK